MLDRPPTPPQSGQVGLPTNTWEFWAIYLSYNFAAHRFFKLLSAVANYACEWICSCLSAGQRVIVLVCFHLFRSAPKMHACLGFSSRPPWTMCCRLISCYKISQQHLSKTCSLLTVLFKATRSVDASFAWSILLISSSVSVFSSILNHVLSHTVLQLCRKS